MDEMITGSRLGSIVAVMFLDYLITLSDSLSLGLSSTLLHLLFPHLACLVLPNDLLIRSHDLLCGSLTFYHCYRYY
jgi:hypothetical protein